MRKISVEALTTDSAKKILDGPVDGFTVVEFPKPSGGQRNLAYEAYLSEKDAYDLIFFLCMTTPALAIGDLYEFFAAFLDYVVRGAVKVLNLEQEWVRLGLFPKLLDITYIKLLRKLTKDHATYPQQVIESAEADFHSSLTKRFLLPSTLISLDDFRPWLRDSMLNYFDGVDKKDRNAGAHIFKDLLSTGVNTFTTEFPPAHKDAVSDDTRLGKKVLLLAHLETKAADGLIPELPMMAMRLVRAFMAEKVSQGRDVQFRTMRVSIPGITYSDKDTLVLP